MDDQQPTKPRASIEDVVQDLVKRRTSFENFCQEAKSHLEKCLRDAEIPFQSIQSRVKDEAKIKSKYSDLSKADKYLSLDDLTDIAGLRVITYYEDDVDKVKELIEQEFAIDVENCEDKRLPENPETFTYHALHLVVSLKPETLGKRAHKQFAGIRGEIQITSILRHAWAEIEHRWYDLKDSFPTSVKRRFARLSALIDLADEQFVDLREEWAQVKTSIDRSVEGGFVDIPIDAQSLRAFIEQEPLVSEIDRAIAKKVDTEFRDEIPLNHAFLTGGTRESVSINSLGTIGKLRDTLRINREKLIELVEGPKFHPAEWTVLRGDCLNILSISLANGLLRPASDKSP